MSLPIPPSSSLPSSQSMGLDSAQDRQVAMHYTQSSNSPPSTLSSPQDSNIFSECLNKIKQFLSALWDWFTSLSCFKSAPPSSNTLINSGQPTQSSQAAPLGSTTPVTTPTNSIGTSSVTSSTTGISATEESCKKGLLEKFINRDIFHKVMNSSGWWSESLSHRYAIMMKIGNNENDEIITFIRNPREICGDLLPHDPHWEFNRLNNLREKYLTVEVFEITIIGYCVHTKAVYRFDFDGNPVALQDKRSTVEYRDKRPANGYKFSETEYLDIFNQITANWNLSEAQKTAVKTTHRR